MKPSTKPAQPNRFMHRRFGAGLAACTLLALPAVASAHDLHLDPAAAAQTANHSHPVESWSELAASLPADIFELIASAIVTPADAIGNATITERGNYRYIKSNGLPNHATGRFPNAGNPTPSAPKATVSAFRSTRARKARPPRPAAT